MPGKFVYISGPYSSAPEQNTQRAMRVWHELYDLGFVPFCPHLTHYLHLERERDYEDWMQYDFAWIAKCDALLRLSGESPGADREVSLADKLGLPIVHTVQELLRLY